MSARFFQNRLLSSESPVGKSWNRNCPNQINPLDMRRFIQITLILFHLRLGLQKLSTTFLGLSESNKYPNKFLCLHRLYQICISWFSQAIPVECLLYQNYFMFLSSPITHRLVAIARICSGMNMLELALDGLNWNMFLPQWEIMHQQKLWWDKVAFGSRKVAVGSGKVARAVFSFFFFWLHTSRKDILNSSKTQLKGIPTSFPILAGEIQMTRSGPNALHWPQSKI